MNRLSLIFILLTVLALPGCNSRPDNVLSDGEMEDLLVDVYKSEAIIDLNESQYSNDSMKAVVKQSVFLKHNVTQEEYDSSLVWYGHNISRYVKIYENVIARLEDEEYDVKKVDKSVKRNITKVQRKYPTSGDTADIWENERVWIFMKQYGTNIMRFEYPSKTDDKKGDRYNLIFRIRNSVSPISAYLGADYYDGTTSYFYRSTLFEGENSLALQCDSTKRVKRIYGYVLSRPYENEVAFVDSIILLRTRLDRVKYASFNYQKWAGQKSLNPETIAKRKAEEDRLKKEYDEKVKNQQQAADTMRGPRRYVPKAGLYKNGHSKVND